MATSTDEHVQATNDDSSNCKFSAVKLSYWKDNYVQYFARQTHHKPPEINRGYYIRVKAIDSIILQFFEKTKGKCQVVNLGAGYDTRFWNFYDFDTKLIKWLELDFDSTVRKKINIIKSKIELIDRLRADDSIIEASQIHSPIGYHLVSVDLRNINLVANLILNDCKVDTSLPTLFIAECVLVYLKSKDSSNLLRWISSKFDNALFVNYEQVNLNDRFGEVMLDNLEKRGCPLLGHIYCSSINSQIERFINCGWSNAQCMDMLQIYKNLSASEKKRIESLEFLDDFEMVAQLFTHYCVTLANKGDSSLLSTIKII